MGRPNDSTGLGASAQLLSLALFRDQILALVRDERGGVSRSGPSARDA